MFSLNGKIALVTGASRGIGKASAEALAAQGARVVVSSRKADACQAVADGIIAKGGEAMVVPCNISHLDQIEALVARVLEAWGRIDILVCNAAVNPYFGPLREVPESAYDKVMDSNVKANVWLCNKVIPQMAERKDGAVIIVSSIAAFIGSAMLGTYGLSKAADVALARNLAVEWGQSNIRVNCVNPGIIRTHFSKALWEDPKVHAKAIESYPMGRIGEPEEVAGAVVFLASAAAGFITGQTITIDGGATIYGGEI